MITRNFKRVSFLSIAAGAIAIGLAIAPAKADEIVSVLPYGEIDLSDNSAEELIKGDGNTGGTIIEVGDILSGIATIGTVEDITIGGTSDVNELTAYFQIEVTSVTAFNGTTCATALYCYTFGASSAFATELENDFGVTDATGAMVIFFEDSANNYLRETSLATGYANATDGSKYWLFGLDDTDDYWEATASSNDIAIASTISPTLSFGSFQIALSLLANYSPRTLGELECDALAHDGSGVVHSTNDLCAQGQLLGTNGENTGFSSYDDVNFRLNVVPEPATIGIFGLGLLGLGLVGRRRRRTV